MALTGHERIAARNIKGAFNWEFGGMYNSFLDGETEFPTLNQMKDMVYDCAMNDDYRTAGSVHFDRAPKEMRFAGEEFCRKYIDKLFAKDPDVKEVPWAEEEITEETTEEITTEENTQEDTEMENKREMLSNMTVKQLREEAKAQGIEGVSRAKKEALIEAIMNAANAEPAFNVTISKVHMYAFTGMYIGEFDATVKDGNIVVNTASKGELVFDITTGKEITAANKARYANRVERA